MRCLSHSCTETADDTYNFAKLNETTQQLEHIEQGKVLRKVIRDYSDGGIYCCAPQCANDATSCCNHIKGMSYSTCMCCVVLRSYSVVHNIKVIHFHQLLLLEACLVASRLAT